MTTPDGKDAGLMAVADGLMDGVAGFTGWRGKPPAVAHRNAIYAALSAERDRAEAAMRERDWQPIETAPRDGTVVDLWLQSLIWLADGGQQVAVEFRVPAAQWFDQQWCDEDGNPHPWIKDWKGEVIRLSHWRPLPAPPLSEPLPAAAHDLTGDA